MFFLEKEIILFYFEGKNEEKNHREFAFVSYMIYIECLMYENL